MNMTFLHMLVGLTIHMLAGALPSTWSDDDAGALIQQALEASQRGDSQQAIVFATKAIEKDRSRNDGWLVRARLYEGRSEYGKAAEDYSVVLKREPGDPALWQRRGEVNFKQGKAAESIADFDQYLKLSPEQKPYHWQRGISLYYAGRYADGKRQFELHQTVNPHDVENAAWHFLCTARADGLAAARKSLIPIEGDARVPMSQVHALFAGKAKPDDVLKAAEDATATSKRTEPLFYANLYLGLYYEAIGDKAKAREFILKAAERSKENGYMGDVARVHADMLAKSQK